MTKGDHSFAVKRTATGLGLFAIEPILANKRVIEYTGPVLTNEEADKKGEKDLMTIDEKYVIDGSPAVKLGDYPLKPGNTTIVDKLVTVGKSVRTIPCLLPVREMTSTCFLSSVP